MRGTSLIEALLAIAIIGLLFAVAGAFTVRAEQFFTIEQTRTALEGQLAVGLEPIRDDGLRARAILSSHTLQGTVYNSSSSTLVLEVPTLGSGGSLVPSSSDFVAFLRDPLAPARVIRVYEAAFGSERRTGTETIARGIDGLHFLFTSTTPAGSRTFDALLSASSTVRGRAIRGALSSFVTLLNQ